jgi:hypothetical protein
MIYIQGIHDCLISGQGSNMPFAQLFSGQGLSGGGGGGTRRSRAPSWRQYWSAPRSESTHGVTVRRAPGSPVRGHRGGAGVARSEVVGSDSIGWRGRSSGGGDLAGQRRLWSDDGNGGCVERGAVVVAAAGRRHVLSAM